MRRALSCQTCVLFLTALVLAGPLPLLGQTLRVDAFPTGLRPLGVDLLSVDDSLAGSIVVAVGNSGEDSISLFRAIYVISSDSFRLELLSTVRGIPAPYGVASCVASSVYSVPVGNRLLVSSPSDGSVAVVRIPEGTIVGKIPVGPQPHAVACFRDNTGVLKGVVSNLGDDSLVVLDVDSLKVESRIAGVSGSKGLHGISASQNGPAWVTGTQVNTVTLVDLPASRVLTRIAVRGPTSVRGNCVASATDNEVACYDASLSATKLFSAPSPQDFVSGSYAYHSGVRLASAGPNNSVAYVLTPFGEPSQEGRISGIPGAAGLAGCNELDTRFFAVVTSPDSNKLFLVQRGTSTPHEFGVTDGAGFLSRVAANSLASLFATTGVSGSFAASSLPLPKTLGGVSVRVGGNLTYDPFGDRWTYSATGSIEAPLLFVGSTQVNFQIPPEIGAGDSVPAQLRKPDGTTLLTTLRVAASAPGIFTLLMTGSGQAAALNQDSTLNGNSQSIVGAKPAARGSVIQIFATGAGATNPAVAAGVAAPTSPLAFTVAQPTVTLGGKNAVVQFSGLAPGFVGLWQINAVISADVTPGNAVSLSISAAGQTSNSVTIAVQ